MDAPESAIKMQRFIRSESESLEDLVHLLEGRVFHSTRLSLLQSILDRKAILPFSQSGVTSFGYPNGFFKRRDCVSVFDYREAPPNPTDRHRCSPFYPAKPGEDGVALLFLNEMAHSSLIPWTRWKDERAFGEMIVPYVEAGHPGPISIGFIDEIISLTLVEDPDCHAAMLRRALAVVPRNSVSTNED